ncbi:hypothetical protein [Pseudoxanthomonas putridarboris]|uniref:Esterase/lipase superfamily enzyme n=1 Tax=Pseudoxanthomonas putridarboris TaxID=752605 RepID=A0ABU9J363_9GAMM
MSWRLSATWLIVLLSGLTACRSIPDKQWSVPDGDAPDATSGIRVIQIDEGVPKGDSQRSGEFFNAADFDALKAWLERGNGAPIVVYIHGWHHNASGKKDNLPRFKQFITQLDRDICDVARLAKSAASCTQVQGIYVGWRGDSLDPWILPDILDVGTFGGRKRASARVGTGDLQRILKLVSSFKDRDLFVAGHSLGANALYHAFDRLKPEVGDGHNYFMLNPATTSAEFEALSRRIAPASPSSSSLTGLREAQERVQRREHRKLMIIQAKNDWVVRSLFGTAYGLPIGFDEERRTHFANAAPLSACPKLVGKPPGNYCRFTLESGLTIKADAASEDQCEVLFGQSVWIVEADRSLSSSHGDIWDTEQRCALSELIAKRINRLQGY